MGCAASKSDDEEAVRLCRDRKNFIKQAVKQRIRFASGHVAYVQSLRLVSLALCNFIEGEERHEFHSDSYSTSTSIPIQKISADVIIIPLETLSSAPSNSEHYLLPGGNPFVSVEEGPQPSETMGIDSCYSMDHFVIDGFYTEQSSSMDLPFLSSPNNNPSLPPPSSEKSQWDFFWNPFSSLDSNGYSSQSSMDHIATDEMEVPRQVHDGEAIPDLEELSRPRINPVEDNVEKDTVHQVEFKSHRPEGLEISETRHAVDLDVSNQEIVENREGDEETTSFTAHIYRRPTNMSEAMRGIEDQFMRICDCAHQVSENLEASRAKYCSNELAVIRKLNPVALLHSASSRSSSSRFLLASTSSRDENRESGSDFSEESNFISGSHHSTLDRLYAWEKKLYEEVKIEERIRIAYEKKCMQLRNQDATGAETSAVDKTRRAIRDLHTELKVSLRSIEAISKRIETLRDEELHPQLKELIQGLEKMWRTMADCHQIQKLAIDEAKLLTSAAPPPTTPPSRLARSAAVLESELRNWRACFTAWISAQRSYAQALSSWLLRYGSLPGPTGHKLENLPLSPPPGAPQIFTTCMQWSRLLDSAIEGPVVEVLEFFAAGIGTVIRQLEEEEKVRKAAEKVVVVVVEEGDVDVEVVAEEKTAEIAVRVACAGMSAAVGSLADFAVNCRNGYRELAGW